MALTPYYARYLLSQQDLLSRILSFNRDFHAKQRRFIEAKAPEQISDTLTVITLMLVPLALIVHMAVEIITTIKRM